MLTKASSFKMRFPFKIKTFCIFIAEAILQQKLETRKTSSATVKGTDEGPALQCTACADCYQWKAEGKPASGQHAV